MKAASGGDKVSVPAGAKAGQLSLHPCHYGTEQGSYAADCGTLVVPENRAKPGSRLIGVKVIRIKARSAHPGAPVFRLEGGPGGTNMKFSWRAGSPTSHDVVLVGYRGIDSSVRLDCPEVSVGAEALRPTSSAQKSFRRLHPGLPRLRRSAPGGRRRSRRLHAASSRSTISRPPAGPSATAGSTWSARAPARASR